MPAPASELKFNEDYYVRNPDRKDKAWCNRMITAMRSEWGNIVDRATVEKNRKIVDARQDLEDVKRKFKDAPAGKQGFKEKTKWIPIAIYNRLVKIMMAEFIKSAYTPKVSAIDVAAQKKKKRDKTMLENRSTLESVMNALNNQVGDPQYKMPVEDFEGNIEDFDKMGLNSDDNDDIEFFFSSFYRLWQETSAQELTRALLRYNKFEKHVRKLVVDLIAANTICFQNFASPFTGEIKWFYHPPEAVKAIKGEMDDYSDAPAIGIEKNVTIRRWLELAGKSFDFQNSTDREALKNAVNFYSHTRFYSIDHKGDCFELDDEGVNLIKKASYTDLLKYSVGAGYIEWKSIDGVAYKKSKQSGIRVEVNYDSTLESENYTRETEEYEKVYKSWYLVTGANTQELYRNGPLYHQATKGADDEFVSYSIHIIQSTDKSIIEITEQYNYIVQLAFYCILWGMYESHPNIDYYDYDAMIGVVATMVPQNAAGTGDSMFADGQGGASRNAVEGQLTEIINNYANSTQRLFVRPEKPGGGTDRPHFSEPGGVDPLSVAMTTVLDWGENKILNQIGIEARSPETPNPKLGKAVQQNAIQASENATFDVPMMLNQLVEDTATCSLKIAQDAIQYKTNVYYWILTLIGDDDVDSIKSLEGIPYHRYGMFVTMFNSQQKVEKVKAMAYESLQKGKIDDAQYAQIESMEDPEKILMLLAYYAQKTQKRLQQEAALAHQRKMEEINSQTQGQLAVEAARKDREMAVEDLKGQYYVAANKSAAEADIAKKQIDVDSNRQRMDERADADIRLAREKANLTKQEPLPTNVSEPQDQPPVVASV
jgi:hypothetical protein